MNKNKVIINMLWRFAERCGSYGVNFVVAIVLARVLSPDEYGTVTLVTVFIAIMQIFVYSGFPNALIQKKVAGDLEFSTAFYFNMASSLVMYALLYALAPVIARFYETSQLLWIIRVLGLKLILAGLLSVQTAYIQRSMQFKKYFYATFVGTIISAVIGISMVYTGFGVWALVGQALSAVVVNTAILWGISGFKLKRMFSFSVLRELFSYSWKLLVASLVDNIYINLRTLIIGKAYTTAELAYYNKGEDFPKLIINNLRISIDSVLFPSMARAQDDVKRLKSMTRRSIKTTSYLVWPCMLGLIACAEPLVEFLLTDAWLETVPFMRLFCVSYAFSPMQTANQNAIKALGRSDIYMKLQVIGKVVGVVTILATMPFGVHAIAVGTVFVAIFEMLIKAAPNKKLIDYGYLEQLQDILPSALLACVMGACVWWLQYLELPLILVLAIQASTGVIIYLGLSALFKMETFMLLLELVGNALKKLKQKGAENK